MKRLWALPPLLGSVLALWSLEPGHRLLVTAGVWSVGLYRSNVTRSTSINLEKIDVESTVRTPLGDVWCNSAWCRPHPRGERGRWSWPDYGSAILNQRYHDYPEALWPEEE